MNNIMEPSLSVLRQQMAAQSRAATNVHHLAVAMFKPGTKIEYYVGWDEKRRSYFGECVAVCGSAGTTRLRVRNLATLKEREIELRQVTGLVKEN